MVDLAINEDLGIKSIKELYTGLLKELDNSDDTVLDFSSVKRIDLSVEQVLMVINRLARNKNKCVKLKRVNDNVLNQLKIVGLVK